MSITPMDIQNKEFERSFRGYDIEDVDEFLDQVARDLEQLIRDNVDLKEKTSQLVEMNKNYQKMESTLNNAIVLAQETAEEVKLKAKREADLIKMEAQREAAKLIDDARYRSSKILADKEEYFKQVQVFKMRFRSFIEAQLAALESEDWMDEPFIEPKADKTEPDYGPEIELEPEPDFRPDIEFKPDPEFDDETGFESETDLVPDPDFSSTIDFKPKEDSPPKPGFMNNDEENEADPEF